MSSSAATRHAWPHHGGVHEWTSPNGGSFSSAANWNPSAGVGANDTARFDLGDETYVVTFPNITHQSQQLIIGDDAVTFALDNASYEVGATVIVGEAAGTTFPVGFFADTGTLTIQESVLQAGTVILGLASTEFGDVQIRSEGTLNVDGSGGDARLEFASSLRVGSSGSGVLNITDGGEMTARSSSNNPFVFLGQNDSGVGTVNV
mgnify:CR=1 FL=1